MKDYLYKTLQLIRQYFPLILFSSSTLILSIALIMEYFFALKPCKLCLYQRWPYYLTLLLTLAYLFLPQKFIRLMIITIATGAFIGGACLAFYHAGIEYGIFTNIFNCEASKSTFSNLNDLKAHILANQAVPCDKPVFKFIFTLSGWNFFISATLGIFGIIYILNSRKNT